MKTSVFKTCCFILFGGILASTCSLQELPFPVSQTLPPSRQIGTVAPATPPANEKNSLNPEKYAFPDAINPSGKYLFFLHGEIIEEQGLPAVSPEFGGYDYAGILKKMDSYGLTIISELRVKDADVGEYARRTSDQVRQLLAAGVPEKNITVVGASKGAVIAILASNMLANLDLNYVLLGSCAADEVQKLVDGKVTLAGNVLSIYDEGDVYAGSCGDLFAFSRDRGLERSEEIVLHTGLGHGLLFKPLDDWVVPVILWAGKPGCRCDPSEDPGRG